MTKLFTASFTAEQVILYSLFLRTLNGFDKLHHYIGASISSIIGVEANSLVTQVSFKKCTTYCSIIFTLRRITSGKKKSGEFPVVYLFVHCRKVYLQYCLHGRSNEACELLNAVPQPNNEKTVKIRKHRRLQRR